MQASFKTPLLPTVSSFIPNNCQRPVRCAASRSTVRPDQSQLLVFNLPLRATCTSAARQHFPCPSSDGKVTRILLRRFWGWRKYVGDFVPYSSLLIVVFISLLYMLIGYNPYVSKLVTWILSTDGKVIWAERFWGSGRSLSDSKRSPNEALGYRTR